MAETVIGTAGIFLTLALIAILSFVVGLVIYGVYDYFHRMGHSHKHSHRRHAPGLRTSPSELADTVHKAAERAKQSLLERTVDMEHLDPHVGWETMVELQLAMMHGVEGVLLPGMAPMQRDVYRRVFRAISAETLAADLGSGRPVNVFGVMKQRLQVLAESHSTAPGKLLHIDVVDRCEAALRNVLGERLSRPDGFRHVLEDVISSAVTLDLVEVIH